MEKVLIKTFNCGSYDKCVECEKLTRITKPYSAIYSLYLKSVLLKYFYFHLIAACINIKNITLMYPIFYKNTKAVPEVRKNFATCIYLNTV